MSLPADAGCAFRAIGAGSRVLTPRIRNGCAVYESFMAVPEVSGLGFSWVMGRGRFCRYEAAMTVLIYVDTSKQVGDRDHLKVFANANAAEAWFAENDPQGVAFEYLVLE
jgi:hypothetical protein